ncbi:MAG TPA: acetoacetate--CoA ligase [candidate division Zixibacteria bacterium]|nr:acetoacetate--CoA ligase [candidate division Zixibacteria bacterium]
MTTANPVKPIWAPSEKRAKASNMARYLRTISQKTGQRLDLYDQLYNWSIENIETFWASIWDLSEIRHSKKYETIINGNDIWNTSWFEGARLNFAENLLRVGNEHTAIIATSESRSRVSISYKELRSQVAACAAGLRELGVSKDDRVAAFIPNIPEAIIAMLATTSIGAVWSSCSPDFGFQSVMDRFGQIKPKVLIASDGYVYNGKKFDSIPKINQVIDAIDSIEQVVIVPLLNKTASSKKSIMWNDLLKDKSAQLEFEQLPFDHPVYIMYSSGTTGVPKCIVHGSGGTLLQHFKEHYLHTNLTSADVITYYTTCGWMMWNWLVSSLQIGATIYLHDGSPSHPNLGVLWKSVEEEKISVFGTSPKFLSACQNRRLKPGKESDLSSLKTILSTGSPLTEPQYEWVYKNVKEDVQLSSITGGTDIISCFALGNPMLPVYPGELQCRGLGMKVECFDDKGHPMIDEVGELVCTAPFPSRPIYFWNDPDKSKYKSAYFEHFHGVWRHGDFVKITDRGTVIVYGRSDATLNPGGIRIGTAEIYAPLEALPEIQDSLVIGQKWEDDVRIVLFVVLSDGQKLNNGLLDKIKKTIKDGATPRHVPSKIIQVTDIPHTINGKKVEIAVTRIVHGMPVLNVDALANPQSLEQFKNIPELAKP